MPEVGPPSTSLRVLRIGARIALLAGAIGSIVLMLRTSPNMPPLLVVLIGLWVMSPFVILALGDALAMRRPLLSRATIHVLAIVLAVVSLTIYQAVAFGPPRPKPAFFFVLIPPISWLVIATGVGVAALVSRKRSVRSA